MPDLLKSLMINIISNLVSWLIVVSVSLLSVIWYINRYHRRLRSFYGLVKESDRLLVYLSSVPSSGVVTRFGTKYLRDVLTLVTEEVEAVSWLSAMFSANPLQGLPEDIRKLFTGRWSFRPVDLDLQPSPISETELEFSPMLVIGGPVFNSAAKYFQEKGLAHLIFDIPSSSIDNSVPLYIEISKGKDKGHKIPDPGCDLGIIERIIDEEHQISILYTAGIGPNGTKAAMYYLTQHWRQIMNKTEGSANKPFAICIQCPRKDVVSDGYRRSEVLYQWPP